jgi:hypothetical protein
MEKKMTEEVLHTRDEISNAMLILLKMRKECADDGEYTKEEKYKAINLALNGLGNMPVTD